MIAPYKIYFNKRSSLEFDCLTELAFDSDSGNTESYLSKDAVFADSYDGSRRKLHGYKYNEVLVAQITLIKFDASDLTKEESRAILSWLTSSKNGGFLSVYYDDSECVGYELFGNFINCEQYKLANGRVVGIVAEFECISPYAYSPLRSVTRSVKDSATFDIVSYSDELEGVVYPKITVTTTDSNDVTISHNGITTMTQTSSGEQEEPMVVEVKNNNAGETIIIDGANKIITSDKPNRVFANNFSWNWLPFIVDNNSITVNGSCNITFEWREPIKIGSV